MKFSELLQEGAMSRITTTYMAYRFGKLLKKDFTDWEAYKFGLIDEEGKIIKKPTSKEEKNTLGTIETLARKIKKTLLKYVGNRKVMFTVMALYLMKRESVDVKIEEALNATLTESEIASTIELLKIIEEEKIYS